MTVDCSGNGGNLSFGCRWLITIFDFNFVTSVMDGAVVRPATVYLPFVCMAIVVGGGFTGEFGDAKTVCFSNVRSLHRAEINGKSKCLLRSRSTLISMAGGAIGADLLSSLDIDDIRVGPFDVINLVAAVERGSVVTGASML